MSPLREVAALFTRLGFTAFGGPAAHVALMEDEVVRRRGWLDRTHFLDLLAAVNFVPGPNSTEMAIHLGYLRAGWRGLIVGGFCFILPAVLIILPLGWLYVTYAYASPSPHVVAALAGIKACVVAIVAAALVRFARTGVKDRFTAIIAIVATLIGFAADPAVTARLERHHFLNAGAARSIAHLDVDLILLALAAIAGAAWYGRARLPTINASSMPLLAPLAQTLVGPSSEYVRMALFFLKVGATLFGSGYVLVSYLQAGVVDEHHWMTQQQLLDAIAIGQVTPGPLLTTATFIGYVLGHGRFGGGVSGGVSGALLATAAIFLPSFLFIAVIGPILPRIRRHPLARGALDGANAAVVALILVVSLRLGASALHGPVTIGIAIVSLIALLAWNVNSTWLILGAAVIGVAAGRIGYRV
jgi:chromate transporter